MSCLLDDLGLLGVEIGGKLLGIAARGLRGLAFLIFVTHEAGAEGFDFFLGGGAHIGRRNPATKAPRGGDGLQARNTRTHDEGIGRGHGAGGCHHHGEALS